MVLLHVRRCGRASRGRPPSPQLSKPLERGAEDAARPDRKGRVRYAWWRRALPLYGDVIRSAPYARSPRRRFPGSA